MTSKQKRAQLRSYLHLPRGLLYPRKLEPHAVKLAKAIKTFATTTRDMKLSKSVVTALSQMVKDECRSNYEDVNEADLEANRRVYNPETARMTVSDKWCCQCFQPIPKGTSLYATTVEYGTKHDGHSCIDISRALRHEECPRVVVGNENFADLGKMDKDFRSALDKRAIELCDEIAKKCCNWYTEDDKVFLRLHRHGVDDALYYFCVYCYDNPLKRVGDIRVL
jgi:hypothetical protein